MAGSYTTLSSDILTWMENNTTELQAVIPTIISNAELRLSRDLRVYGFKTSTTGNFTIGVNTVTRPTDILEVANFSYVNSSGAIAVLKRATLEYIYEAYPTSSTSPPSKYSLRDLSTFVIGPNPDAPYVWTLSYYQKPVSLSAAKPTNWFTSYAYDALQAASFADAARYVLDDRQSNLIAVWEQTYQNRVAAINDLDSRFERDDYEVQRISSANKPPRGQ
jgi:hypothetical protein